MNIMLAAAYNFKRMMRNCASIILSYFERIYFCISELLKQLLLRKAAVKARLIMVIKILSWCKLLCKKNTL